MKNTRLNEIKIYNLSLQQLSEAYIRNNSIDWLDVFEHIKNFVSGDMSQKEFFNYCDSIGIALEVVDGVGLVGGQFDLNSRKIIMMLTNDILNQILDSDLDDLLSLATIFWINFIHEDTHRQQLKAAGDFNIFKNYKPSTVSDWTEDLGKDLNYFNQQVEADAYGREIGAKLENIYNDSNVYKIFSDINANKIKDLYCKKIINVYKDPRISDKANKSFFRALYDFLNKNEKDITELKSRSLEEFVEKHRNDDAFKLKEV